MFCIDLYSDLEIIHRHDNCFEPNSNTQFKYDTLNRRHWSLIVQPSRVTHCYSLPEHHDQGVSIHNVYKVPSLILSLETGHPY
jgi:hypothetical protein